MLVLKIIGIVVVVIGGFICNIWYQEAVEKRFNYRINDSENMMMIATAALTLVFAILWADYLPGSNIKYFIEDLISNTNIMVLTAISALSIVTILYRNFSNTNLFYGSVTSIYHVGIITAAQIVIAGGLLGGIFLLMGFFLIAGMIFK